jgi:hypothetical protein
MRMSPVFTGDVFFLQNVSRFLLANQRFELIKLKQTNRLTVNCVQDKIKTTKINIFENKQT